MLWNWLKKSLLRSFPIHYISRFYFHSKRSRRSSCLKYHAHI